MSGFKILVSGKSGVGKSGYIQRLTTGHFSTEDTLSSFVMNGVAITFTTDVETALPIDGIILMFDATNLPSASSLIEEYTDLSTRFPGIPITLASNKWDCVSEVTRYYHTHFNGFLRTLYTSIPGLSVTSISVKSIYDLEKPIQKLIHR
jgi:GTPase SAR1 family protein